METSSSNRIELLVLCGLGAAARFLFSEEPIAGRVLLANLCLALFIALAASIAAKAFGLDEAMWVKMVAGALCYLGPTAVTAFLRKLIRDAVKDETAKRVGE